MNESIQKFDINLMLDEKLNELIQVRGMRRDEAIQLIAQAAQEWQASQRPADRHETSSGKMKAYVNLRTRHISREPERTPGVDECQFDDVTAAAIYVSDLERPMLEMMRRGKLGE